MTYSALIWTFAAMLLVGGVTAVNVLGERRDGPVISFSNGPITEEQVRQKMTANGWTSIQITREGRYLQVTGAKEQQTRQFSIDSQTGRPRDDDDDD